MMLSRHDSILNMKASHTILMVIASMLLAALSSCTSQHAIKPGHAMIEIDRSGESQKRILHPKFVSVNGRALSSAKRSVQLPEGPQEVMIRFAFRRGDFHDAKLRFKARANERYSVRFVPHPYTLPSELRTGNYVGGGGEAAPFVMFGQYIKRRVEKEIRSMENRSTDVEWAYIRVFPSDIARGAVAEVRVP